MSSKIALDVLSWPRKFNAGNRNRSLGSNLSELQTVLSRLSEVTERWIKLAKACNLFAEGYFSLCLLFTAGGFHYEVQRVDVFDPSHDLDGLFCDRKGDTLSHWFWITNYYLDGIWNFRPANESDPDVGHREGWYKQELRKVSTGRCLFSFSDYNFLLCM